MHPAYSEYFVLSLPNKALTHHMGSAARAKVPSPATKCLGADNVEPPPPPPRKVKIFKTSKPESCVFYNKLNAPRARDCKQCVSTVMHCT